jgi:hypothetical protein
MLSIYLAIPTSGTMDYRFVECQDELLLDAAVNPDYHIKRNDGRKFATQSGIHRARSIEATKFLLNKNLGDVLMMIDDDMVFSTEEVYQVCREAHEKKAVVGAAYLFRRDPTRIVLGVMSKGIEEVTFGPGGHLKEVAGIGGGFMAIDRSVLENLAKTLPVLNGNANGNTLIPFFHPIIKEELMVEIGEDVSFCERVRDAGIKVYCDTQITGVGHLSTRSYSMDDDDVREKIK